MIVFDASVAMKLLTADQKFFAVAAHSPYQGRVEVLE